MKQALKPVIKWSGSKRLVAASIARHFPDARHFFDPFVGGGSLLPFRPCQPATAGDIMPELIELWNLIKKQPQLVVREYRNRWQDRLDHGHTVYYDIRERFNKYRDPLDFLFLSRTCVNGLIRFNADGNFNNSLHHTRPGITPERLEKIVDQWHEVIQSVQFRTADYQATLNEAKRGDLVFLDPPYFGTRGRYLPNSFTIERFLQQLEDLNCKDVHWVLTFDGGAGERQYTRAIPPELYKHEFSIASGNSTFCKVMDKSVDAVRETVYLNFAPVAALPLQ